MQHCFLNREKWNFGVSSPLERLYFRWMTETWSEVSSEVIINSRVKQLCFAVQFSHWPVPTQGLRVYSLWPINTVNFNKNCLQCYVQLLQYHHHQQQKNLYLIILTLWRQEAFHSLTVQFLLQEIMQIYPTSYSFAESKIKLAV